MMHQKKKRHFKWILLFLAALLAFPLGLASALAASEITHTPPEGEYVPGFRIHLDVEIKDSGDLLAARCYFKTRQDENFGFTNLFDEGGGNYKAVLPAPWIHSEAVEYLFVAVNANKAVARSPLYVIEEKEVEAADVWQDAADVKEVRLDTVQEAVEDYEAFRRALKRRYSHELPGYQGAERTDTLMVKTELSREAVPLTGFSDMAVVTEVADHLKYGLQLDGLYSGQALAASEGAGGAAGKAGLSTLSKVGIGAVVVGGAAVGVAAAADDDDDDDGGGSSGGTGGSGGSGDSGDSGGSGGGDTSLNSTTILGDWSFSGQRRDGVSRSGSIDFRDNGTQVFSVTDADGQSDGSGSGTWELSGSTLTVDFSGAMSTWIGTVSGDSSSFTLDTTTGTNHGIYTFTR
jgi:hypothetical protein